MTTDQEHIPSLDDPDIIVQTPATIYDSIPPLEPRTEREAEFYTLGDGEMFINLGPQHPSTHGVLRVKLKLDGEKVISSECIIGYLHRGVEKIGENRTYSQFAPYVDRTDYVAAVSNGLGYCEAVEKLLGAEAPPRARWVRSSRSDSSRPPDGGCAGYSASSAAPHASNARRRSRNAGRWRVDERRRGRGRA